jgi:hypothetical protein
MKSPKLALTVLRLLAPGHENIVGDVVEQFRAGKSRLWLWRQVAAAIIHVAVRELRSHPFRAARAVLMGAFLWIGMRLVFAAVELPEWLFTTGISPSLFQQGITFPSWMRGFPANAVWKSVVFAASGWIVARTHSRLPTIVLLYVGFIVCSNAVAFTFYMIDPQRYYSISQLIVHLLVLYPVAALGGGLWGLIGCEARRLATS